MKISNKWIKIAEIYKIFAIGDNLDFSEKAAEEMYNFESKGKGNMDIDCFIINNNGYMNGKKWLNVIVKMWKEDIELGILYMIELYNDKKYPHWWLNKIFNRTQAPINWLNISNL